MLGAFAASAQSGSGITLDINIATSGARRQAGANGPVNQQVFTDRASGWTCHLIRTGADPTALLRCAKGDSESAMAVDCRNPAMRSANLIIGRSAGHQRIATFSLTCR